MYVLSTDSHISPPHDGADAVRCFECGTAGDMYEWPSSGMGISLIDARNGIFSRRPGSSGSVGGCRSDSETWIAAPFSGSIL